jgi:hypothetical protein
MTQYVLIGMHALLSTLPSLDVLVMHALLSTLPSLDVLVMLPVKNVVLNIAWLHGT